MRILLIALIAREGNPIFTLEMANALMRQGHDVYAVIPKEEINLDNWLKDLGEERLCLLDIGGEGSINKAKDLCRYLLNHRKQLKNIEGIDFDYAIYTMHHRWNQPVRFFVHAQKSLIIIHDPVAHSGVKKWREWIAHRQFRTMDGAIVLTRKFIPDVMRIHQIPEEKIYYMPHFITYHSKQKAQMRCEFDDNLGVNFLFFGRIEKYKGIGVLLEAFLKLAEMNHDAKLTIAGRGEMQEYQSLIDSSDRITADIRYIPEDDVDDYYLEPNTVLVLPYLDATQSGVLSIAYTHGNPVIASDTGGLREQLGDGEEGILVPPGDADELAKAMRMLCDDRDRLREQSWRMLLKAKEFSSDHAVKILMDQLV